MEFSNRDEYRKKFTLASSDVQDLMSSPDTLDIIVSMAGKYNINKNNIGNLSYLVGEVMLDMINLEKFKAELVAWFGIKQENANTLAAEMQEMLFSKIKSSMAEKDGGVTDDSRRLMSQAKRPSIGMWFVSRERQNIANQVRGKLGKVERLVKQVQSFGRAPSNMPSQTLNQ